ncbi:MAG: hypothetical protein ABL971_03980 [Vicinamibacterales bacterium]
MAHAHHLTDSRLHELWEMHAPDPHLASCAACQARLAEIDGVTSAVQTAADVAFSEAFPDRRVEASRHRILQAVERLNRPGQIVTFPGTPFVAARQRTRPRWMVAAAAGLILGLGLGRLTHPGSLAPALQPAAALSPVAPASYSVVADDDLLFALETASTGPVPVLRSIHELTPLSDQPDPLW